VRANLDDPVLELRQDGGLSGLSPARLLGGNETGEQSSDRGVGRRCDWSRGRGCEVSLVDPLPEARADTGRLPLRDRAALTRSAQQRLPHLHQQRVDRGQLRTRPLSGQRPALLAPPVGAAATAWIDWN
jgi:hypothetical protein